MKYLAYFIIGIYFFSFSPSAIFAQAATATPTPTTGAAVIPTGEPTCDLCGWCKPAQKPPNWDSCQTCLYETTGVPKPKAYYTVFGCLSTTADSFVKSILSIVFGVSGGIAFLSFLYGSALVMTSAGDPIRLQTGKDTISSSILGILLIVFSIFLLRLVGYDILKIPGFG